VINKKMKHLMKTIASIFLLVHALNSSAADYLDGISAVVEDDIILDSELVTEVTGIVSRLQSQQVQLPEKEVLYKQVLERLILEKLQIQLAERQGIRVSDDYLQSSIESIAANNKMSVATFRRSLVSEGMDFKVFQDKVRREIRLNQLRNREIGQRVTVSDQEVTHYLATETSLADKNRQYLVGHILLSLPEDASALLIQEKMRQAKLMVEKLKQGADFKQMAVAQSASDTALQGGSLGWRSLSGLPSLFVGSIKIMSKGGVSKPLRSPGGLHILKLLDSTGGEAHMITETHVRHILLKTNELVSDEEAKKRLQVIRERIIDGDNFSTLAKANSEDTGSAVKGGDLSWVMPGLLVPAFEKVMINLPLSEISQPVQTQFGWHIIQVLERRTKDNSQEHKIDQARDEIRKRKIESETELWLRRLRDESYVDIRLGLLNE